jgi:hypothetical protein
VVVQSVSVQVNACDRDRTTSVAKSRQAPETEIERAAAPSTTPIATVLAQSQP